MPQNNRKQNTNKNTKGGKVHQEENKKQESSLFIFTIFVTLKQEKNRLKRISRRGTKTTKKRRGIGSTNHLHHSISAKSIILGTSQ